MVLPSTLTTKDGNVVHYKDHGPKDGPVVTFSHDGSSQSRDGNPMDLYANAPAFAQA